MRTTISEAVDEMRERRLHPVADISDEPMGLDELQAIVWRAVEAGSLQAMRLYRDILEWRKEHTPKCDPFDELMG